jgi:hypothetical protein
MSTRRDPDLLTIRRSFRLLQQADLGLLTHQARGLAFALESLASSCGQAPRRQAEARRLADRLFRPLEESV